MNKILLFSDHQKLEYWFFTIVDIIKKSSYYKKNKIKFNINEKSFIINNFCLRFITEYEFTNNKLKGLGNYKLYYNCENNLEKDLEQELKKYLEEENE